jgi:hypothetical protein
MLRSLITALMTVLLVGCSDNQGFRENGAGLSLSPESIAEDAATQNAYFLELCQLAAIVPPTATTCPASDLTEITLVGMNDIDLRCDRYLNWIDNVRTERLTVNRGAVAVGGFLGGVLGLHAPESDALSYIALALGFGTDLYNTYQNSILLGLESSTVHQIVYERRNAFRQSLAQELGESRVTTRSRSVYLLRSYLRICTPNTIVMDVNAFARGGVLGGGPSAESRAQDVLGVRPPTPDDPAGLRIPGQPTNRHSDIAVIRNFDDGDLRSLQRDMCISTQGGVGPETRVNVRMFEYGEWGEIRDGRVNDEELDMIGRGSCPAGAENVFEKRIGGEAITVQSILEDIRDAELADVPQDTSQLTLGSGEFRRVINIARVALLQDEDSNLAANEAIIVGPDARPGSEQYLRRLQSQVTPALIQAIQERKDQVDEGN